MASEDRTTPADLIEALARQPHQFDFFFALRLIEAAHRQKPRLGKGLRVADDPVRLGQLPSLRFETSTIAGYEREAPGRPPRLVSRFLGLFGPNGPLPLHLTEYADDRVRHHRDRTFGRFADLFHHRMLSLFYRAWADSEPTVHCDRPDSDRFADYVGALFGIGMKSLVGRDQVADNAKRHYAGLLACQTHHPDGLRALLSDYFQQPVEIEEFVGEWLALPGDALCLLGGSTAATRLGEGAVLGARVWSCQQRFRLLVGPLSLQDYLEFLPIGRALGRLQALVRNYLGDQMAWDLRLCLAGEEIPPLQLGGTQSMLGWTTWLGHREPERIADDLVLSTGSTNVE